VLQNYVVTKGPTTLIRQVGSSVKGRPRIRIKGRQKLCNLLCIVLMLVNTIRLVEIFTRK
jgi:hypothetical protein